MTNKQKQKKKAQLQEPQQQTKEKELVGSAEYLADHKFDRTIKTMQTNILQHNQSKKLEILRTAQELENQGYPITKICDRITKALQGPKYETSGSYVRKVLPPKYKDQEQMATALKQNNGKNAGYKDYRLRDQVAKKRVEEVTLEDVKFLNWSKAKQVAKHQMEKALW